MNNNFFPKISKTLENIYQFQVREKTILEELFTPAKRFDELGVKDTIVFFGSAMKINPDELKTTSDTRLLKMAKYYKDAEILAENLTKWLMTKFENKNHCVICTGGGGGVMESANKGAKNAGGNSIGLNITIPYEQTPNQYQSNEMKFVFHYFFMRKFWFSYLAKAIVVFPGGFGTLDELFEIYTLIKTDKSHNKVPVILYGKEYWNSILNFDEMLKWRTIPEKFNDIINIQDDINEVLEILKKNIKFSEE